MKKIIILLMIACLFSMPSAFAHDSEKPIEDFVKTENGVCIINGLEFHIKTVPIKWSVYYPDKVSYMEFYVINKTANRIYIEWNNVRGWRTDGEETFKIVFGTIRKDFRGMVTMPDEAVFPNTCSVTNSIYFMSGTDGEFTGSFSIGDKDKGEKTVNAKLSIPIKTYGTEAKNYKIEVQAQ